VAVGSTYEAGFNMIIPPPVVLAGREGPNPRAGTELDGTFLLALSRYPVDGQRREPTAALAPRLSRLAYGIRLFCGSYGAGKHPDTAHLSVLVLAQERVGSGKLDAGFCAPCPLLDTLSAYLFTPDCSCCSCSAARCSLILASVLVRHRRSIDDQNTRFSFMF
jgi:hypothetical protein